MQIKIYHFRREEDKATEEGRLMRRQVDRKKWRHDRYFGAAITLRQDGKRGFQLQKLVKALIDAMDLTLPPLD